MREFTRLSNYAPEMLVNEEEKCHKFEDGLNDHIQAQAHQLQVHKEVLLGEKMFLVVPIVEENTREIVGD